jgi:LPXTG-motif cell wall-anchored protein
LKRSLRLIAVTLLVLLFASAPANAAESFLVTCHVCDKVDAVGKGLDANTTYTLTIRDLRTGQQVISSSTTIRTDASGSFKESYPLDLAAHPSLQGSLYDSAGTDTIVAAHSRFTAPLECGRKVALPYTGTSSTTLLAVLAAALMGAGGALVLVTRARQRA